MTLSLLDFLLQPSATSGAAAMGAASSGSAASAGGVGPLGLGPGSLNIIMIVVMLAVMYFVLIRPQTKVREKHEAMIASLQKGSVVRTNGGIRGTIIDLDDREVTLKIAEKTKINVLRSQIAGLDKVESNETASASAGDKA